MRMKAAVLYEKRKPLVVEEIEIDPPRAGEVLVKMVASGICHSDVHRYTGDAAAKFPIILGHEGAGIVAEVGEGVTKVKPGDHVVVTFLPACGKCHWCHIGHPNKCDLIAYVEKGTMLDGTTRLHRASDGMDINSFLFNSTYAEYLVAPTESLVPVPEHIPLERACLLGCGFTTGFGAVTNRIHIRPGETITIVGCGGLGLSAVQGARVSTAGKIIAVDVHDEKLVMAKKFGATHTIRNNHNVQEVVDKVMEITWGLGTDYTVEYVGFDQSDETLAIAFQCLRKGGTMLMVGVGADDKRTLPFDPFTLTMWRKKVMGVMFGHAQFQSDIPRFVGLMEDGKIDLDGLVTRELSLEQINEGFEAVLAGNQVARQVIRF